MHTVRAPLGPCDRGRADLCDRPELAQPKQLGYGKPRACDQWRSLRDACRRNELLRRPARSPRREALVTTTNTSPITATTLTRQRCRREERGTDPFRVHLDVDTHEPVVSCA